jgi:hypothetical protein
MNTGILFMLGIVAAVLGCFGAFIAHLMRRARIAASVDSGTNPQEGAAQW